MVDEKSVPAKDVHESLARHMLIDGMPLVLDLDRSSPSRIVDARSGRSYIDFFCHFASAPLGTNPPELASEDAHRRLLRAAVNNPANSDIYTSEMARFVDTFSRVGIPDELPHLFLIAGGTEDQERSEPHASAEPPWRARKTATEAV